MIIRISRDELVKKKGEIALPKELSSPLDPEQLKKTMHHAVFEALANNPEEPSK